MIDGRHIYDAMKAGTMVLRDTRDDVLRELLGHLARKGKITGTAGRIWGEAIAEAALRFMQAAEKPETRDQKPQADEGTGALTDFIKTDPDA